MHKKQRGVGWGHTNGVSDEGAGADGEGLAGHAGAAAVLDVAVSFDDVPELLVGDVGVVGGAPGRERRVLVLRSGRKVKQAQV